MSTAPLLFPSDNATGVSAPVLQAIAAANRGTALAYGDDAWSQQLDHRFSQWFETPVRLIPAPTGTAANSLALAALAPPYGEILCHAQAHILTTECGGPEFYSGGARLTAVGGAAGKIDAAALQELLHAHSQPSRHHLRPAAISITQATEAGTLYGTDELQTLSRLARAHGLALHMDGARFANALAATGASPAEMSWKAGVDLLSLGTTKNGTMNAEAVLVFNEARAQDLLLRHKRAGLLASKMRFHAAQLLAWLDGDLCLHNARHANAQARALERVLCAADGVRMVHPVQTNQLFAALPDGVAARLARCGIHFRRWTAAGPQGQAPVYRLVTSFETSDQDIARVRDALAAV